MNFDFGDYYSGERKSIIKSLFPNQLFLSKSKFFNVPLLQAVLDYFENKIIFPNLFPEIVYITNNLFKKKFFKSVVNEFINIFLPSVIIEQIDTKDLEKLSKIITSADIGIKDLKIIEKKNKNFLEQLIGLKKELISYHTTTTNKKVAFSFDRESSGTQWLFALGYLFLKTLETGALIVIDEFEKNLHPNLVTSFLEIFNSELINQNGAQIIFTTHSTEILDSKLLRFDQIWFTEKNELGISELFCLKDFEGIRKENAIKDWYINGRFGGVPLIDKYNLKKILSYNE